MIRKETLLEVLRKGVVEARLQIPERVLEQLIDYVELLCKWNLVHNLTAVRNPLEMIKRHLLDSLVTLPFLPAGSTLDVGTGAGLPGIPLALCRPDQNFVLVDSNQKKITFVQHMILSLKLRNTTAISVRVEDYQPSERFDVVISRAFASLSDFVRLCGPLCHENGRLVAMKGAISPEEIAEVPLPYTIEQIQSLQVPSLVGARSLVFIHKTEA